MGDFFNPKNTIDQYFERFKIHVCLAIIVILSSLGRGAVLSLNRAFEQTKAVDLDLLFAAWKPWQKLLF